MRWNEFIKPHYSTPPSPPNPPLPTQPSSEVFFHLPVEYYYVRLCFGDLSSKLALLIISIYFVCFFGVFVAAVEGLGNSSICPSCFFFCLFLGRHLETLSSCNTIVRASFAMVRKWHSFCCFEVRDIEAFCNFVVVCYNLDFYRVTCYEAIQ